MRRRMELKRLGIETKGKRWLGHRGARGRMLCFAKEADAVEAAIEDELIALRAMDAPGPSPVPPEEPVAPRRIIFGLL